MTRYVAFLRGVSPMNAKMADLKRCFESAGFADVTTVLASGNVVFSATKRPTAALERDIEAVMQTHLGRTFYTIVRSVEELQAMLEADPFEAFKLPAKAKRVVSFLRTKTKPAQPLPVTLEDAQILTATGREVFSAYIPGPEGPVFMALIEKTFGKNITTRTWETVKKCGAR